MSISWLSENHQDGRFSLWSLLNYQIYHIDLIYTWSLCFYHNPVCCSWRMTLATVFVLSNKTLLRAWSAQVLSNYCWPLGDLSWATVTVKSLHLPSILCFLPEHERLRRTYMEKMKSFHRDSGCHSIRSTFHWGSHICLHRFSGGAIWSCSLAIFRTIMAGFIFISLSPGTAAGENL